MKKTVGQVSSRIIMSVVTAIVIIIVLFPLIWILPSAFKGRTEIFSIPATFLPKIFTTENFAKVFNPSSYDDWNFVKSFVSTFLVASAGMTLSLMFNMMTAYVFARLEFRGKKILWIFFLFSMFVPGITILLTSFKVVSMLGMLDTFAVLVLPGVMSSYNIFFFRQFFFGIPSSIEDAAMIDGCSRFKIFFSMFIPLSRTPMIIIGANVFMGYWNSFLWPTLTITKNNNLIQMMQIIRTLNDRYPSDYGIVIAATMLSLIGPFAIFAIAQKYIVEGIAISGIK